MVRPVAYLWGGGEEGEEEEEEVVEEEVEIKVLFCVGLHNYFCPALTPTSLDLLAS